MLFLDPCNEGPFQDYLSRAFGAPPVAKTSAELAGFRINHSCWANGFCMSTPEDYFFCSTGAGTFATGGRGAGLLRRDLFDVVVYGFLQPVPPTFSGFAVRRDW
jgi:hypothetical protein